MQFHSAKTPFSHVINDSFWCAHLSVACPPVLSQVCLNEKREAERVCGSSWKEDQTYTARHKPLSPRASSSVSTSVMYLKSMHETICLGSWIDTHQTCCLPCDHTPDINRAPTFPLTHHVNKQLPQRLQENNDNRLWVMTCRTRGRKWCFSNNASPHLALSSRPQVPHSIQDCGSGQVDHSFLWA